MKGLDGYVMAIKDLMEIGLPRKVIIRAIDSLYENGKLNKWEAMRLKILTCKTDCGLQNKLK